MSKQTPEKTMRYPCNLFGQPASPWIFWSSTMPARIRQRPREPVPPAAPTSQIREWVGIGWNGAISRQVTMRS
jgi:hypothetical protein